MQEVVIAGQSRKLIVMKRSLGLVLLALLLRQAALGEHPSDNESSRELAKRGIYEHIGVTTIGETFAQCNPHPLAGLKTICIAADPLPNGERVDLSKFKKQLIDAGLQIIDHATALQNVEPILALRAVRTGKTLQCTISILDVVKIKREPSPIYPACKYRLEWWRCRTDALSYQQGFDNLIKQLIAEYRVMNPQNK